MWRRRRCPLPCAACVLAGRSAWLPAPGWVPLRCSAGEGPALTKEREGWELAGSEKTTRNSGEPPARFVVSNWEPVDTEGHWKHSSQIKTTCRGRGRGGTTALLSIQMTEWTCCHIKTLPIAVWPHFGCKTKATGTTFNSAEQLCWKRELHFCS